jgi:phosphoribosylaminoimidazolecarboxamide formyltransferase/IMP cyclohydrolase
LAEAWQRAFATDKQAPFGGIIAVNRPLDLACAEAIAEIFSEVIVAPEFNAEALALLQKKKNLRVLKVLRNPATDAGMDMRSVGANSYLLQERDNRKLTAADLKIVTKRQPTARELDAMLFGWRVVKNVKSNAIVYADANQTLGIGAGQMSRVDSSRIAVWKAREAVLSLQGSAVCSDAFFPFPDGLIAAAEAGATAAIQPGGSVRDVEVIAAADAHNMTMAFTGVRHFRH